MDTNKDNNRNQYGSEVPHIVVNPNPGANGNISANQVPEDKKNKEQDREVGNEITDGEDA